MTIDRRKRHIAVEPARAEILSAIATLPEEAFGYIIVACMELERNYVGNGGFKPESREGFKAIGKAAKAFMESQP